MASRSAYSTSTNTRAAATPNKERIEAADRIVSVPGVVRPSQNQRRKTTSELSKVRRHGTGEHIRARRSPTGEHRITAKMASVEYSDERLQSPGGGQSRAEVTPNTAILLSQLKYALTEKRDEAFGMALERGDDSSANQYLQGRTHGLTEALALLDKMLRG